jgi:hypothetical protein
MAVQSSATTRQAKPNNDVPQVWPQLGSPFQVDQSPKDSRDDECDDVKGSQPEVKCLHGISLRAGCAATQPSQWIRSELSPETTSSPPVSIRIHGGMTTDLERPADRGFREIAAAGDGSRPVGVRRDELAVRR